jgi:hypothetical protein
MLKVVTALFFAITTNGQTSIHPCFTDDRSVSGKTDANRATDLTVLENVYDVNDPQSSIRSNSQVSKVTYCRDPKKSQKLSYIRFETAEVDVSPSVPVWTGRFSLDGLGDDQVPIDSNAQCNFVSVPAGKYINYIESQYFANEANGLGNFYILMRLSDGSTLLEVNPGLAALGNSKKVSWSYNSKKQLIGLWGYTTEVEDAKSGKTMKYVDGFSVIQLDVTTCFT